MGLFDAVLVKDNHIAVVGSISEAVRKAKSAAQGKVTIEVECDTLAQLSEAVEVGVDMVLLDNMSVDELRQAVASSDGGPRPKRREESRSKPFARSPNREWTSSPWDGSPSRRLRSTSDWTGANGEMSENGAPRCALLAIATICWCSVPARRAFR